MNILFLFGLSFTFVFSCHAFDVKTIGDTISELTSELGITDFPMGKDEKDKVMSEVCAHSCAKQIEEIKKNMTDLYTAFLVLHAEFAHMSQHMIFHEKALKHIALMGHKPKHCSDHHNRDHNFRSDNQTHNTTDDSLANMNLTQELDGKGHNHHHNHHQHQHNHHHNHKHNKMPVIPQYPDIKDNPKKDKESSEESSEESPEKVSKKINSSNGTVIDNLKSVDNKTIATNESQTTTSQILNSTKTSTNTSTSDEEFKQWFENMLNDIHHGHNDINEKIIGESSNRLKFYKLLDESKDNQKYVDEMENALNADDLVFGRCVMRPNRHIALLNQQDIEGTINMWQLRHNRGPLHMHIKLKGFKVGNHVHSHSPLQPSNHTLRRKRESNLMPVEVEPEDTNGGPPVGASHSHGFHVHESANMSRDCQSVGNHYNPLNLSHGGPYDVIRHVGDLGNIRCDRNGHIDVELVYSQVSLSGQHSIINRSLVIHHKTDDYGRNPNNPSSTSTGSSGVRIACCLIEEVNELPKEEDTKGRVGSVAGPAVIETKKRRETNRFGNKDLSGILDLISKYENNRH